MTAIRLDAESIRALAKAIADELDARPVLLTRQQAADWMGVSVQFFDLRVRPVCPPVKLTGAPRWSRSALLEALELPKEDAKAKSRPMRVRAAEGCVAPLSNPRASAILGRLQKRKPAK